MNRERQVLRRRCSTRCRERAEPFRNRWIPIPSAGLTNETLTYKTSPNNSSWGWVSGPNEPRQTNWPATNYVVSLNITQPNASLQIQQVKIYRVNSSGGPGYNGLAQVADLPNLTQSLSTSGVLTFILAGSAQTASLTDRLAVKFYVHNFASSTQSFSYDAGVGTLSRLVVGGSPAPSPVTKPIAIPDFQLGRYDNVPQQQPANWVEFARNEINHEQRRVE